MTTCRWPLYKFQPQRKISNFGVVVPHKLTTQSSGERCYLVFRRSRVQISVNRLDLRNLAGISVRRNYVKLFFLNSHSGGGVQAGSTRHVGHWMAYCTCPGWRIWWYDDWHGKPKYSEKTCPSATLSTTNPTWPDPGRRGEKPATNRMSCGAATWNLIQDSRNAEFSEHEEEVSASRCEPRFLCTCRGPISPYSHNLILNR
jgi:hypothetical protein